MENLNENSLHSVDKHFVKHFGRISKITKKTVTVSLEGHVNCTSCKAKSACGASESNSKKIEVFIDNNSYILNEPVDVLLQKQLGLKAVFWAYVFPFLLMFLVLISASIFFEEWLAGLLALFILIPYYLGLYTFNNSLQKVFKVSLLKHNQQ